MELSPEVIAAHADLSEHSLAYVQAASRSPDHLRRASFAEYESRRVLPAYRLQPWPTIVGPAAVAELARCMEAVNRLCKAVPQRVFAGDFDRLAGFYGLDPAFAARTLDDPAGIARAPARGDFVLGATGLKCLEFNCGSSLGGWQVGLAADLYLNHPLAGGFLAARGAGARHRDSMRLLYAHFAREALAAGIATGDELNVAFTLQPSSSNVDQLDKLAEMLPDVVSTYQPIEVYDARLTATLEHCPPLRRGRNLSGCFDDFEVRDGAAWLEGLRVHAIFEIVGFPTREVFGCYRQGGVHLYSGPISMILGDKRNLALLSQAAEEGGGPWDEEERRLVRTYLPWTRLVRPGTVRFDGGEPSLPELLLAQRPRLVLKRGLAFGGYAVHLGRAATEEGWAALVEQALADGDWVVQEFVASRPYLYQAGEEGCTPHDLIWGLFAFGGQYAGAFLRLQPKQRNAIVNFHQGASVSMLLEVDG